MFGKSSFKPWFLGAGSPGYLLYSLDLNDYDDGKWKLGYSPTISGDGRKLYYSIYRDYNGTPKDNIKRHMLKIDDGGKISTVYEEISTSFYTGLEYCASAPSGNETGSIFVDTISHTGANRNLNIIAENPMQPDNYSIDISEIPIMAVSRLACIDKSGQYIIGTNYWSLEQGTSIMRIFRRQGSTLEGIGTINPANYGNIYLCDASGTKSDTYLLTRASTFEASRMIVYKFQLPPIEQVKPLEYINVPKYGIFCTHVSSDDTVTRIFGVNATPGSLQAIYGDKENDQIVFKQDVISRIDLGNETQAKQMYGLLSDDGLCILIVKKSFPFLSAYGRETVNDVFEPKPIFLNDAIFDSSDSATLPVTSTQMPLHMGYHSALKRHIFPLYLADFKRMLVFAI